jgi:release factor glutamine methyltransferase
VTVLEVIQRGAEHLAKKAVDSPRLQVELMLAQVLNLPRLSLYLNFNRELAESEVAQLRDWVKRRGQREPLQYILGSTSFCGVEIRVNPAVLIPRPETELLAEQAWTWLLKRAATESAEPRILDFGTGSGCLAVVLALRCPTARIWALDKSPSALAVAAANVALHGVQSRIELLEADSLAPGNSAAPFDLIVANPPYIPTQDLGQLQPEVRDHEPHLALDGGADGMNHFRALAAQAPSMLRADGRFMAEFGDGQASELPSIFAAPAWQEARIEADHSGRPRILIALPGPLT